MEKPQTLLPRIDCALVIATTSYVIQFASPGARPWMAEFFRARQDSRRLPFLVRGWLDGADSKTALVIRKDKQRLFVRQYWPHPLDTVALCLEVIDQERANEVLRVHASLTRRENEVLGWIAYGKSNRDIAEILELSVSTVGKHLERIFLKLGVENRISAANCYRPSQENDI